MADAEAPQFLVVLDTQPIDQALFQFDIGVFRQLRDEAKRQHVQLVMTDIQVYEVRSHVTDQVRQLKKLKTALEAGAGSKSIRKHTDVSKDGGIPLPRLLKHHLVKSALEELDRSAESVMQSFERLINGQEIRIVNSGQVLASRVMPNYFDAKPPFGGGRKKNEFPDAFSIEAIRDLAAVSAGAQLVVVSDDEDWAMAFADDDAIVFLSSIAEALQHVRKLDGIGTTVSDLLVGIHTRLNELIEEHFPEISFSLGGDWSGDVDDVSVQSSEIGKIAVTSFRDRKATVEFEASISFHAEASYPDDDWTEWYPTYMNAIIEAQEIMVGTADIMLNKELTEIEDVDNVSFDDAAVEVSLDDATRIYRKRSAVQ